MPIEIIFIVILILSVVFHEIAHGWTAYAYGDPTAKLAGRLTLNPIKHIDPLGSIIIPGILVLTGASLLFGWAKPVPYNPYNLPSRFAEALVAGAGVIVNFTLSIIFALFIRFIPDLPPEVAAIFGVIVIVNLFLGILNILPIPPLDGSKILKCVLPLNLSQKFDEFEKTFISRVGILGTFAIIFIIIFFLLGPLFGGIYSLFDLLTGSSFSSLVF